MAVTNNILNTFLIPIPWVDKSYSIHLEWLFLLSFSYDVKRRYRTSGVNG